MGNYRSNLVEVNVQLHHETEKAWLVSITGEKKDAVWVPRSQAELHEKGSIHVLECPEWLATDKGLV